MLSAIYRQFNGNRTPGITVSPHAYTEDQLVEQPAIGLFAELGWQTRFRYRGCA